MNYNIQRKKKKHKNLEVKYNLQQQIQILQKKFINLLIYLMEIV